MSYGTLREGLWKDGTGRDGYAKGKGKTMKGGGKKDSGNSGGLKGGPSGESKC